MEFDESDAYYQPSADEEELNDLNFLKEMRKYVQEGWDKKDVTRIEYALKMIDDWISEKE